MPHFNLVNDSHSSKPHNTLESDKHIQGRAAGHLNSNRLSVLKHNAFYQQSCDDALTFESFVGGHATCMLC
jgi:hypothetical protein